MNFSASRRRLLLAAGASAPLALLPGWVSASGLGAPCARHLSFHHLHTGEKLDVTYCENGAYLPDALAEINHLLRDFRSDTVHVIDPALLNLLDDLRELTGAQEFQIVSGFRSPATNARLRRSSHGGVARYSLHMEGKAVDVLAPGVPLATLRRAAVSLQAGGVGYYPADGFVHVDTGRVRYW